MLDWFVRLKRKAIDLRELTLLETSYFAGAFALSLVLPLLMSFRGPQDAATKRSCMKTVWSGQALFTLAGLAALASAPFAPYAAAFGLVSCICCVRVLLRQFRQAHAP
jgi:hypothetical protein